MVFNVITSAESLWDWNVGIFGHTIILPFTFSYLKQQPLYYISQFYFSLRNLGLWHGLRTLWVFSWWVGWSMWTVGAWWLDCQLENLRVTSLAGHFQGNWTYMVTQDSRVSFQETGSGSCQFFKACVQKLAQHCCYHMLIVTIVTEPPKCEGRRHWLHYSMGWMLIYLQLLLINRVNGW